MKTNASLLHSVDVMVEIRVTLRNHLIVSRVNHTHIARIRQAIAPIDQI